MTTPESPIEEIKKVHEADKSDSEFKDRIIRQLRISLAIIVVMVGTGTAITTYNSVNNAPKIQCIYEFSKTGVNDIHHLEAQDHNKKDYPGATCE